MITRKHVETQCNIKNMSSNRERDSQYCPHREGRYLSRVGPQLSIKRDQIPRFYLHYVVEHQKRKKPNTASTNISLLQSRSLMIPPDAILVLLLPPTIPITACTTSQQRLKQSNWHASLQPARLPSLYRLKRAWIPTVSLDGRVHLGLPFWIWRR